MHECIIIICTGVCTCVYVCVCWLMELFPPVCSHLPSCSNEWVFYCTSRAHHIREKDQMAPPYILWPHEIAVRSINEIHPFLTNLVNNCFTVPIQISKFFSRTGGYLTAFLTHFRRKRNSELTWSCHISKPQAAKDVENSEAFRALGLLDHSSKSKIFNGSPLGP